MGVYCVHVYVAKILESLKQWEGQQFPVEIHARTKDEAHNEELFQKMTDIMAKHGVCFTISTSFVNRKPYVLVVMFDV
jgi:hypothetical protein